MPSCLWKCNRWGTFYKLYKIKSLTPFSQEDASEAQLGTSANPHHRGQGMSVGFGLRTQSLQRCMRLHINCIEFGQPWASIAFVLNITEKYEMEITFSIRAFFPKALQRCTHSHPSEQNCIGVESQTLLLLQESVCGTCCQKAAVGNALLHSSFLYSPFPKSLPFLTTFSSYHPSPMRITKPTTHTKNGILMNAKIGVSVSWVVQSKNKTLMQMWFIH